MASKGSYERALERGLLRPAILIAVSDNGAVETKLQDGQAWHGGDGLLRDTFDWCEAADQIGSDDASNLIISNPQGEQFPEYLASARVRNPRSTKRPRRV